MLSHRTLRGAALVCLLLAAGRGLQAQDDSEEVKRLKATVKLLEGKIAYQNKQIEDLRQEITALKAIAESTLSVRLPGTPTTARLTVMQDRSSPAMIPYQADQVIVSFDSHVIWLAGRAERMPNFIRLQYKEVNKPGVELKGPRIRRGNRSVGYSVSSDLPEVAAVDEWDAQFGRVVTFKQAGEVCLTFNIDGNLWVLPILARDLPVRIGATEAEITAAMGEPDEKKPVTLSVDHTCVVDGITYAPEKDAAKVNVQHWTFDDFPNAVLSVRDGRLDRVASLWNDAELAMANERLDKVVQGQWGAQLPRLVTQVEIQNIRAAQAFGTDIERFRDNGLDVVIVFDSTGSMEKIITALHAGMPRLRNALTYLVPGARVGLVTYRDHARYDPEAKFVTKRTELVTLNDAGVRTLQNWIRGIGAQGGGDIQEAVMEGVEDAVRNMRWKARSEKVIIVVGDAPPHTQDGGLQKTCDLCKAWHDDRKGTLSCLDTNDDSGPPMEEFKKMALAGGGRTGKVRHPNLLVNELMLCIFGERFKSQIDAALTQK